MARGFTDPRSGFTFTGIDSPIASNDEAVAAGWSEIDYAPRLPMANFIGVCPDCMESFERWPVADDRTE